MITVPLLQQQDPEEQAGKTDNHSVFAIGAGLTPLSEAGCGDTSAPWRGLEEERHHWCLGALCRVNPNAVLCPLLPGRCEKCYLCKSLVPLLQYQRHVDSCLQAARQAQGTRRLRRAQVRGDPAHHPLCFVLGVGLGWQQELLPCLAGMS